MSKNNNNSSARGGGEKEKARQINMNALSGAGFDHLYGLSSVLNALEANRRDFSPPEQDLIFDGSEIRIIKNDEDDDGDDNQEERFGATAGGNLPERKPEAQFKPWLFVQERGEAQGGRSSAKASSADQVTALAEELGLPVAEVDKGVLNTLCGNRPHQVRQHSFLRYDSTVYWRHILVHLALTFSTIFSLGALLGICTLVTHRGLCCDVENSSLNNCPAFLIREMIHRHRLFGSCWMKWSIHKIWAPCCGPHSFWEVQEPAFWCVPKTRPRPPP
jgi:hypothetical protein